MAPDDNEANSDNGSPIDVVTHESNQNSAIFIALAFGIFSVLILFSEVAKFSLGWFVLTAIYWFIFAFGIRSIVLWALNALILNHYRSQVVSDMDKDLNDAIQHNFFLRNLYNSMWKDNDLSKSNAVIWVGIIGCIILGVLLWYVIAMNDVCFSVITQNTTNSDVIKCGFTI